MEMRAFVSSKLSARFFPDKHIVFLQQCFSGSDLVDKSSENRER